MEYVKDYKDDTDLYLNNPAFYNLTVKNMIQMIPDSTNKFIFVFVFMLGFKKKEAAEVIGIHETNISRRIINIRKRLLIFHPKGKENTKKLS